MIQHKNGISEWLTGRASWHGRAVLGVVLVAFVVRAARRREDGGIDNGIVMRAAETWWSGGSPYDDPHFLYLPGAVLAATPLAALPDAVVRWLVPAAITGALLAGWWCALRMYGADARSRLGVYGALGLAVGFAPFRHLVELGNWTASAVVALPAALLAVSRGRWVAGAVVVGAVVAVKPLLAPVALLFLFARRWRALAVVAGLPAVISVAAGLAMPDPAGFLTRTLPFLMSGDDDFVRLYEASLGAVLPRLGVPQATASVIAVAAAGAGVGAAWLRWRRPDPASGEGARPGGEEAARLGETAALLMLGAFLVSRPSYDHYLLVVVPLLLAGVALPGAAARSPWFWVALVPQLPGVVWPYLETRQHRAFRDAVTLCVLTGTVAARSLAPLGERVPARVRELGTRTVF